MNGVPAATVPTDVATLLMAVVAGVTVMVAVVWLAL